MPAPLFDRLILYYYRQFRKWQTSLLEGGLNLSKLVSPLRELLELGEGHLELPRSHLGLVLAGEPCVVQGVADGVEQVDHEGLGGVVVVHLVRVQLLLDGAAIWEESPQEQPHVEHGLF